MHLNSLILIILAFITTACGRTTANYSSFSSISEEPIRVRDEFIRYTSVSDTDFCRKRSADECFTLILKIPSPELERNLSLSALAISLNAEKFRLPTLRSCERGLAAYARGYQGHSATLRAKLFSRIRETRCVIDLVRRETYDLPQLPHGQFGMAFRLADWNVLGETAETTIRPLTFTVQSASLAGAYREATIFSRSEGETESKWNDLFAKEFRPLGGLRPLSTRTFSTKFNGQFQAKFSTMDSAQLLTDGIERIRKVNLDNKMIAGFLSEAREDIQALLNGDSSKVSWALFALAIDAIKSVKPDELMQQKLTSHKIVEDVKKAFGADDVIDSASNALFTDSHLALPGKLIDDAFSSAHAGQLTMALDIRPTNSAEPPDLF
jgi:hypothetical protein